MHDEFEMRMMDELNFFLGLQIKKLEDGIFFNQSKYIKEMLKKVGLEDSKPIKTPMSFKTKLTPNEDGESVDDTKYQGMIGISPSKLLNTPKTTPLPLSSPPPIPSQLSKQSSPLAITLDPIELIFSTPPTSPHPFVDSLEDLPPRTTNLPPRPSFDIFERLANQPPPLPTMEPPIPPLPPQLSPLGSNNPFPMLTHEMFCDHFQRMQVIVNDLHEEMRFILNYILEHLGVFAHKNNS
uniref:Retrovirus-related Pol polyprotein from transposon TNT 1-94 n=1 Tax=Tanacetum cinerariifolium TaxID=118510 RepID=A0A6L2L5V3_TANCI|nr:retrovirus-related Pol polyprotein from transposon TNT 1-94 [Tanacetum cinerariifolium]